MNQVNFALQHFFDILCILVGTAYGISTVGKISSKPRGLFLYRLGSLLLLIGGALGLLHGFQKIDWVHRHHYAIWYYAWTLESVGFGMTVVVIILGIHKDVEPRPKASKL